MRTLLRGGISFDESGNERVFDIALEDGVISAMEEHIDVDERHFEVMDVTGRYILPGLVDMHCNICDPGYETRDDILTVSRSAAKGGFTSVACMPNTFPVIDDKTVVSYVLTKSRQLSMINIFPCGSMTKGLEGAAMAEIGEMRKAGIVAVSDGGKALQNAGLLRNIMIYSGMFGIPVITACNDETLSGGGVMNKGDYATLVGLSGIPREAEETYIARNLLLAKYSKSRLHISPVSTRGGAELIRRAKSEGTTVTCETFPFYYTLTEGAIGNYNTFAKITPPLRTDDDVAAIAEALADGTIDVIASGHDPTTIDSKRVEFDKASYGISSIEITLPLSYTELVVGGKMSLYELVNKLSANPAGILGLESKGGLKIGGDADLIVFDPDEQWYIDAGAFASKAKFSPYHGMPVRGKVKYTFVNGNLIYLE